MAPSSASTASRAKSRCKRDNFRETFTAFAQARHYSDWKFSAAIPETTPGVDGAVSAANGDHAPLPGRRTLPRAGP